MHHEANLSLLNDSFPLSHRIRPIHLSALSPLPALPSPRPSLTRIPSDLKPRHKPTTVPGINHIQPPHDVPGVDHGLPRTVARVRARHALVAADPGVVRADAAD